MTAANMLAALLSDDHVILTLRVASKAALLADLARRASALTGLPAAALRSALAAREALGSTGFGAGIAVPHARIAGLADPCGLLVRLDKALAYDAIDGKPVDLVFLLLTPSGQDSAHLALLAAISRRLRDKTVADAVRAATTPAQAGRILVDDGRSPPLG
jgi:PTS system nitrogen regulatory IIA component